jgi:hypothetical protein
MTEFGRLGRTGSPLARELLRAGREEVPSARVSERTARAIALGVGATAALSVAAPISGAASAGAGQAVAGALLSTMAAKWTGIGILVGVTAAGTVGGIGHVLSDRPQATPTVRQSAVQTAPRAAPRPSPLASVPVEVPSVMASAAPAHAHRSPMLRLPNPPLASSAESSLTREVAELDRAREALQRGDPARAMHELGEYEATSRTGVFREDALYLRMEVLASAGNRPAAAQTARDLLRTFPASAHAGRARELAGVPIP